MLYIVTRSCGILQNVESTEYQKMFAVLVTGRNIQDLYANLIRCFVLGLQALFTFKPVPPKMEARTHLQIGQVLMGYTKNIDLARSHLEQAVGS